MAVVHVQCIIPVHPVPPLPALPFPLKPDGHVQVLEFTQVATSTQILVTHRIPEWEYCEGRRLR